MPYELVTSRAIFTNRLIRSLSNSLAFFYLGDLFRVHKMRHGRS